MKLLSLGNRRLQEEKDLPIRVMKVFGDFSSRFYITRGRVSSISNDPALKSFLQRTLARDILVVGIDPVWDIEILRVIPAGAGIISFVNEEDLTEHELISNFLRERQGRYILASYDTFVRELHYNLYRENIPLSYKNMQDILDELNNLRKQIAILRSEVKDLQNETGDLSS